MAIFKQITIIKNTPSFIVVIGASAGGFSALDQLVKGFDKSVDAAYCIVLHLSSIEAERFLVDRLQPNTDLPCSMAEEGAVIKRGNIYIGKPGKHFLIKEDKIILGAGPEENNFRPSIDVLFRSAAVAFGGYTIGIILTGLLYDGTSGMETIRSSGGSLIVQDPDEAEYPSMPQSVLRAVKVDYCLPIAEIPFAIKEIVKNKPIIRKPVPMEVIAEAKRSEKMAVVIEGMDGFGEKSPYGCPDCGGVLWKVEDGEIKRYRCHIGHTYMEEDLLLKQLKGAEAALWVAIRMMEERKHLLKKRVEEYVARNLFRIADDYNRKIEAVEIQIEHLKGILTVSETSDAM